MIQFLKRFVKIGFVSYCYYYCFNTFGWTIVYCTGHSMEPTVRNNDLVLVNRFSLRRNVFDEDFLRNKVVIVRSPIDPTELLCKRVVLTSIDSVRLRKLSAISSSSQSKLPVDFPPNCLSQSGIPDVPNGSVFLMGDHTTASRDSREIGPVPIGLIFGIVEMRVWPSVEKIV